MGTLINTRRAAVVLTLVFLLACVLAASPAFADVTTRTQGEAIPSSALSGTWMVYGGEVGLDGGQAIYSNTAGNTLTFPFTGTGIDWIGVIAPTCGNADVWVDGETPVTVDLHISTPAEYNKKLWARAGLSSGPHVLHIRVQGNGNVNVDALDVHTPSPPVVSTPASSPWSLALLAAFGLGGVGFLVAKKRAA
jgi:hypothetical protein